MKLLKNFLCGIISATLLLSTAAMPAMAKNDIKVVLDGKTLSFDVSPQIINDRTMVPLRAIFEALGASVDWNSKTKTVTSQKGSTKIELTINSNIMYVNNSRVTIDAPACIIDDRTLVPLRAISEAYSTEVNWDGNNKTVEMYSNDKVISTPKPTATPKPQSNSVLSIKDMKNIGDSSFAFAPRSWLNDSYGNTYSHALYGFEDRTYQTLLNGNYRRFKCTLYTPSGFSSDDTTRIIIRTDGEKIYTSPKLDKTSRPVNVDIDITGCNNFELTVETDGWHEIGIIGDAEFYKDNSSTNNSTDNTEYRSGPHCPNCGSYSFIQINGGKFTCNDCGTKY